jgi:hypothetical protein
MPPATPSTSALMSHETIPLDLEKPHWAA